MTNCHVCGKLIASGTAESMCRACRMAARASAEEIARSYVQVIAEEQEMAPQPIAEPELPRCVRCRRHEAIPDSHFCVGCQLELVNSLGDAAEELFRTPPPPPLPPVASTVSLMHDLDEKRQRTATSHMRVVGGTKLR